MYTIHTYDSVPDDIKRQVGDLGRICFTSDNDTKENKDDHDDKFYNHNIMSTVLAIDDNRVVGRGRVFLREVEYDDTHITLGGLGDICTHPDQRRQGIGTAIVKSSFKELQKAQCDIAFLCTDVSNPQRTGLYEQVGFQVLNKPYTFMGKSGKLYTEKDGMVAPVMSQEKFDRVMNGSKSLHIGDGNW